MIPDISSRLARPALWFDFSSAIFCFATPDHFIPCSNFRASPSKSRTCLRSAIASPVKRPCRRAFWFPLGAPDPGAPPCMRQRRLPRSAGERHDPQQRVFAPQRGLACIGPVLRG